ncbi:sulfite exporter TauE/SafE family protein [Aequorivita echinoideorum]|uniref:Probable membrane transporter protein n=1 Tax=Aequorivita echinoideorum TaxID=1549647 RepID=A0ABS5S0J5_9FLAO|nr:sulfite exporter TauE/SafE family protein [Aequorivita echinoideorum]MBT0606741.1 sulfite exporter TauE/SafE family protein [Aequorivita echinoideorum]
MDILEIFGYFGALFIGLVLGLIGGGGSILTVPILVYALSFNPVIATAYSLFVVGTTSLVGALKNMMKGRVNFKTAIIFAIPAFTAVYVTRAYLIPSIPLQLFEIGDFTVTKNLAIMIFFAVIMLLASITMIRNGNKKLDNKIPEKKSNHFLLMAQGFFIGIITGMVGAGGGFLIIPALVLLARLPMKNAVATSLFIIAINSLIGFLGDVQNYSIDWYFLILFTSISVIGIFIGIWLNNFIDGKKLKKAFGWFVLIMGIYIIYKEVTL